jgi:hypothetical protein
MRGHTHLLMSRASPIPVPPSFSTPASPQPRPLLAHGNRPLQLRFSRARGYRLHPSSVSSTWGLPVPVWAASHTRFTREPHARRPSSCSRRQQHAGPIVTYATTDLLLQHQIRHLQHTSEALAKRLKTLESRCKHMQHPDKTLATYT